MIKRTLSTVGLWAVVFGTLYFFGVFGGVVLLAVLTLLAQYEFQGLLEKSGLPPWKNTTLALGFTLVLSIGLELPEIFYLALVAISFALVLGALVSVREPSNSHRLAGSVLALAYVPGMMVFYAAISLMGRNAYPESKGHGLGLVIWVIAVAKFTDVGGYLVGSMIGRHKLAPTISPGKTWEGVGGGLVLAAAVAYLPVRYAPEYFEAWLTPIRAVALALPIGVAAIVSDLSESAFKRRAGVKDSGRCIPGIGGALDLADSLLLAGPVAYYLFILIQQ